MYVQKISCPNCNNEIPFDINALMRGESFVCGQCLAKIQISHESLDVVEKSMTEFSKLKANLNKKK